MNTNTLRRYVTRAAAATVTAFASLTAAYGAPLNLSNVPLHLSSRVDPNVLINLSVETPMGGAAYTDQSGIPAGCGGRINDVLSDSAADDIGSCYFPATEYLGYFDPRKCYTYDATNNRFYPSGASTTAASGSTPIRSCSGAWSGNFMNWLGMTAIDEFIWTMTGGNRIVDTTARTVVRRARKQNNNSWFPRKVVDGTINVAPSTVTPFNDSTLFFHNTDFGFQVGTSFGNATGGSPDRGTFALDLEVCNANIGGLAADVSLEPNCVRYTSGAATYYKPEGLIQRNATTKRFAAISYTLDNSASRHGGVMRSNMKYVGPQRPVSGGGGAMETNPAREWDTDGILRNNPDGAGSGYNSGIINYINKFSEPGYKSYDPIGELYYEGLRFFKNLGPTPEYASGLTGDQYGGFQIVTNWEDPIQYRCQKNFIVAINDANPWLDKKLPGTHFTSNSVNGVSLAGADYGEPSNPDTSINVRTLTNTVGALEGINGTSRCIGGGNSDFDNTASNKTIAALGEVLGSCPYVPKQNSYYIAGLAFYANTNDLRNDLQGRQTVSTFMIDTQEFSVSPLTGQMNMLWLAGKYGGFIDLDGNGNPTVTGNSANNTEWDRDGDGQPDNYVLATQPQKLVDGLNRAFVDIDRRTSAAAALAANSTAVSTTTRVYQARFDSTNWTGSIRSLPFNTSGTLGGDEWLDNVAIDAQPWQPASGGTANGREIITWNGSQGIPFQWSTSVLTTAQQSALNGSDSYGQLRLRYLRGDSSQELSGVSSAPYFRNRFGKKLGDIVHSSPIYVAAPRILPDSIESVTHSSFRSAVSSRTPMLYVGANGGMLHGISTSDAREKLAYVPNIVFPYLAELTQPNYQHRYYVDGPLTYGDAFGTGSAASQTNFPACNGDCWRTVLVGGLGAGGKGYFALDITNPANFSEPNASQLALWEFTSQYDDNSSPDIEGIDLGYSFGEATIAKMHAPSGTSRWVAIFGNGYNSTNEKAVLYIVDVRRGNLIRKIVADNTQGGGNGLSAPTVYDADGDLIIDYIYAGDLKGNLWKFDVTNNDPSQWNVAFTDSNGPLPLFRAVDNNGVAQPITTKPVVERHPAGLPGPILYVGTGKYLEQGDETVRASPVNSFYGVWDRNLASSIVPVTRADLLAQTFNTSSSTTRVLSSNTITWRVSGSSVGHLGWRIDMPNTGEIVIADPVYIGLPPASAAPRLVFVSAIPSTTPCDAGGSGFLAIVNPANGGQMDFAALDANGDGNGDRSGSGQQVSAVNLGIGILSRPIVLSDGPSSSGGGTSGVTLRICTQGSSGETNCVESEDEVPSTTPGNIRRSWRQLR